VLRQIRCLTRQTMTRQISRCSDQDARAAGQFARDQLAVGQRGRDTQRQVKATTDDIDQLIIGRQVKRDLRVALQERRQPMRQFLAGHDLRHADAYDPTGLRLPGTHAIIRFLQAIQQRCRLAVVVATGFGQ